jgi:deoxyribodipyrimidine photo-lyase
LGILYGEPHKILKDFVKKNNIKNIYINRDYTPFAIKRVKELKNICNVIEINDYLLFNPKSIRTTSGKAYRVYTPFMKIAEKKNIDKPKNISNNLLKKLCKVKINKKAWDILKNNLKFSEIIGGREEAIKILKNINETQKNYDSCRNYLNYKTSQLSAYIKFGCVSIREAWEAFGTVKGESGKNLKRQLIWREFYYHMYIDFPELLEWDKNPEEVKLDEKAPDIVKACYQQLDKTGYLHNRGRMILANYLLHNKKKYWKSCDKLYARRLVDYDPFVNIGNWLWINKQPKFRWLKPEVQYNKWDKSCPCSNKKVKDGNYTEYYLSL